MNNVKVNFSIKDLENLSGIKAHTIRIWEKRYKLLSPSRTDTNIRYYSIGSLQKLLNITLLYNNGYKISKIAEIPEEKIPIMVREIASEKSLKNHAINAFKLAMIHFDQNLFQNTYTSLLTEKSFREIFKEVFIPMLNELGLLWQTDTISPAHEHFITSLVKQKILINIEKLLGTVPFRTDRTFVLFLPDNEIHELGLLFLHYEISLRGYTSIYLGQTVPMESLKDITRYHSNVVFISYFTVMPHTDEVENYLQTFTDEINLPNESTLWVLGHQIRKSQFPIHIRQVRTFLDIEELVQEL